MNRLNLSAFLVLALQVSLMLNSSQLVLQAEDVPPWAVLKATPDQSPLPGTLQLTDQSDLSSKMIQGIDQFLLKQIALAAENRAQNWNRDLSSPAAYEKSIVPQKQELASILGLSDPLVPGRFAYLESAPQKITNDFAVYEVTWPVLDDLQGQPAFLFCFAYLS